MVCYRLGLGVGVKPEGHTTCSHCVECCVPLPMDRLGPPTSRRGPDPLRVREMVTTCGVDEWSEDWAVIT